MQISPEELNSLIEQKIETVVKRIINKSGYFKGWVGTIANINDDDTVDIRLPGDPTNLITRKKVLNTAGIVEVGDEVYLISPYNRIDNAYVFVNKSYSGTVPIPEEVVTGNLTESTSDVLTITNGTDAVVGSGTQITVKKASGTQDGYLSSVDWNTFNNKEPAITKGDLLGTENQVSVSGGNDVLIGSNVTISLPQNIDTSADVLFDSLVLDDLTASRLISCDSNKKLISVSDLSAWIAGTNNMISVVNDGDGTITLKIPQEIHVSATPVFNTVTGTNLIKGATGQFGDVTGGNYSEFEADGTLKFNGDSTVWRDENFSATITAIGANAPSLVNWDTSSIQIPVFGIANTKELNLLKEYDHAGKTSGSITFHAHVFPTTNAAGTIKFYLEYYIKNDGLPAITGTLSNSISTNSTAWEELRLDIGTVTNTIISQGAQIGARLYRLSTDHGTYEANVAVSTWGYHYEIDMVGSRQITSK